MPFCFRAASSAFTSRMMMMSWAPTCPARGTALRYGTMPRSPLTSITTALSSVSSMSLSAGSRRALVPMPNTERDKAIRGHVGAGDRLARHGIDHPSAELLGPRRRDQQKGEQRDERCHGTSDRARDAYAEVPGGHEL